ncbi:DNA ligase/mRNA capping enzyme [Microstroma glucosiphilum]|uniref:DNA ligase/mRNA capping enzyme n=1 Tax=Pseudomicrostroma glucosiphilum TaxID=1684307 RepID=A0A316UCK4_9BASI|nr:DNA ligase/mRNA capping enzyme [Pseudomicrostroma glucosiphilum]PWN22967.1 DNA ligase/mRNA capping enzyme [Pseudomicrostroma glucosiphilum]
MDPTTPEVAGVRPKLLLAVGEIHEVQGSGKDKWKIRRCEDGYYSCSCGAWKYAKSPSPYNRTCRHLGTVLGVDYETARVKWGEARIKARSTSPTTPLSQPSATQKRPHVDQGGSSVPAASQDESDYGKLMDAKAWPPPQGSSSKIDVDPWTGHSTFNGRALRKGFDAESAVSMMLSETWDLGSMDPAGWWMSEKLDGCRAYWTGDRLISRSNKEWEAPGWFLDKLPKGFALDGELWRERDGFEELSGICRRRDHEGWRTVSFFVFDAPDLPLPYEERLRSARARVPDGEMSPDEALRGKFGGRIATLPMTNCTGRAHLETFLGEIQDLGGEGVMLRRQHSPYERGRSSHSRKVKVWYDAEAQVVRHVPGDGRYKGQMGSLALLMECGTIFTCGSGLTDAMRRDWQPPKGTIVRYRFHEMTQDGCPRFPIYVGICHDRDRPQDAVVKSAGIRLAKRARIDEQSPHRFASLETTHNKGEGSSR